MLKMLNTEVEEEEGEKSDPWLAAFWRGKGMLQNCWSHKLPT